MESTLEVIDAKKENVVILELKGTLDASTSSILEQRLVPRIDHGETQWVIDFSQLNYISSSGLRVLHIAAMRAKNARGKIVLCCLKDHVRQVFDVSGFSHFFPIYPSCDKAINYFL